MLTRRHFLELSTAVPAVLLLPSLPHDSQAPAAASTPSFLPEPPYLPGWVPPPEPAFGPQDVEWFVRRSPYPGDAMYASAISRILEVHDRCEQYYQWYWAQQVAKRLPQCRITRLANYLPERQVFESSDYICHGDIINRRQVDVDEVRSWWSADFESYLTSFLRGSVDNMLDYVESKSLPELQQYRRRNRLSGMVMALTPPLWIVMREGYMLNTTSRMTYGTACHDSARPGPRPA